MEINGWIIEAFPFDYKNNNYIVLVKLYQKNEKKPKYSLLEIEIFAENDFKKSLTTPVNKNGFMIDAKTLRKFFGIEYSKNLGEILNQFKRFFSKFIPTTIIDKKSEKLKKAMIFSLSSSDSEDPDKEYCFAVKRNPSNKRRTLFNDNKTRLLRPDLYKKFQNDASISFCYSANRCDEKTDEEVLSNFSKK